MNCTWLILFNCYILVQHHEAVTYMLHGRNSKHLYTWPNTVLWWSGHHSTNIYFLETVLPWLIFCKIYPGKLIFPDIHEGLSMICTCLKPPLHPHTSGSTISSHNVIVGDVSSDPLRKINGGHLANCQGGVPVVQVGVGWVCTIGNGTVIPLLTQCALHKDTW